MTDIATRVKRIIAERLGLVETAVVEEAHILDDLGADSLDAVEIVIDLEQEFGIEIPDPDMDAIQTVAQAIAVVQRITGQA